MKSKSKIQRHWWTKHWQVQKVRETWDISLFNLQRQGKRLEYSFQKQNKSEMNLKVKLRAGEWNRMHSDHISTHGEGCNITNMLKPNEDLSIYNWMEFGNKRHQIVGGHRLQLRLASVTLVRGPVEGKNLLSHNTGPLWHPIYLSFPC